MSRKGAPPENRRKTGGDNLRHGAASRWKPGQSGNPGGRPRTAVLSQACREKLSEPVPGDAEGRTFAQAIAKMLATKALEGDLRAAQELGDRAEGRPCQSVQIENTTLREAFERMNRTELEAYAEKGTLPDWFRAVEEKREAVN